MSDLMVAIVSILCSILGAIIALSGFIRVAKKDTKEEAGNSAKLEVKLDYVSRGIDDIKLDNKVQAKRIDDINERLVRVETRIEDLEK